MTDCQQHDPAIAVNIEHDVRRQNDFAKFLHVQSLGLGTQRPADCTGACGAPLLEACRAAGGRQPGESFTHGSQPGQQAAEALFATATDQVALAALELCDETLGGLDGCNGRALGLQVNPSAKDPSAPMRSGAPDRRAVPPGRRFRRSGLRRHPPSPGRRVPRIP